jgi:hypothetical protein
VRGARRRRRPVDRAWLRRHAAPTAHDLRRCLPRSIARTAGSGAIQCQLLRIRPGPGSTLPSETVSMRRARSMLRVAGRPIPLRGRRSDGCRFLVADQPASGHSPEVIPAGMRRARSRRNPATLRCSTTSAAKNPARRKKSCMRKLSKVHEPAEDLDGCVVTTAAGGLLRARNDWGPRLSPKNS